MKRVGIRELKQNASAVVAGVVAGEPVIITDRGRPVAQLVPLEEGRFAALDRAGLIEHPTRSLADLPPPVDLGFSLSDEIIRRRGEERY
jgi:prevent-host-death family protein